MPSLGPTEIALLVFFVALWPAGWCLSRAASKKAPSPEPVDRWQWDDRGWK